MEHGRELEKEREGWFIMLDALPVGSNTEEKLLFLEEIFIGLLYYIGDSARGHYELNLLL